MQIRTLYIVLSWIVLTGCISEYEATGIDQISGMLVVEGTISPGETTVNLSFSVPVNAGQTEIWYNGVSGDEFFSTYAKVYVECDDGTRSPEGVYVKDGVFKIENGPLEKGKKYRLYIQLISNEYCSECLEPLFTPEIDKLYYTKRGEGQPVSICIDTGDDLNQSRYYRWTYEENWEVTADFFAEAYEVRMGNEWVIGGYYDNSYNIYYCWGKNASQTFVMGTTDKIAENYLSGKRLIEMAPSDDRLSDLYHISVVQTLLRREAYEYFENMRKNAEDMGGLFSPMPTEIRGNITCITDKDQYVIGYIDVASFTSKSIYIDNSESRLYERPQKHCATSEYGGSDYPLLSVQPRLYAPIGCLDCRTRWKASKNKPEWWPTDNL